MTSSDPRSVVEAYLEALRSHDYERARGYLADRDFRYRSPISSFTDADDFIQYLSLSGGIVQRIAPVKVFADGPDVCHFLRYVIQLSEKESVTVAQWANVANGRIQHLELVFDAHLYRVMFEAPMPGEDGRRPATEPARHVGPGGKPAPDIAPVPLACFFEWRDDWTLDVGFMDEDHRMLADMLNRIARDFGERSGTSPSRKASPGENAAAMFTALDELAAHAREHFHREEDVMRTLGYPDFAAHKSEHGMLLAEYSVMVREIRESGETHLDMTTLDALKQWLMGHVLDVDRQLAEFLKRTDDHALDE